jgi:DNA polymerase-3 subunit alpha
MDKMSNNRLLAFDTETTGLSVEEGDKLIELGVVEYDGLTETGKYYHQYLNPGDKVIGAGAIAVHGITNEMLIGKPKFEDVVEDFLEFLGDSPILIYNASFDLGFVNKGLEELGRAPIDNEIIDVLEIARKRFPRSKLTLDALAKRMGVDTSARTQHGAVVDSRILGSVYRALVQQNELAIAEVASAVISNTTHKKEAKPILMAPSRGLITLPRVESTYTIFNSALQPDAIAKIAAECGYEAVALVDKNTTAGAMSFAEGVKKAKIKGIVGVALPISSSEGNPIVLYARNAEGWKNIQRLVTISNVTNKGAGLTSEQLKNHSEGIAATSGGSDGAIAYILRNKGPEIALKTVRYLANLYKGAFAMEITRHGGTPDSSIEAGITSIAHELSLPVIGTVITRAAPGDAELVEVLRAIGKGHNYQADTTDEEHMRTLPEMVSLFADLPNAVDNAGWISSLCDFLPEKAEPMLPTFDAEGMTEDEAIYAKAREGFERHLKNVDPSQHEVYEDRFNYEMGLITKLKFSGYFLIVADFINWAKDNGIPIGPGRGSGAGSIIAWCLGITALDPIKLKLLFERFINPDRVSLPDFDVDICEEGRGEVIRYVREKYGSDKVVAIGAYGTMQAKQSVKDVGRVMGIPYGRTDRISKIIPKEGITDELMKSQEMRDLLNTTEMREAMALAVRIQGLVKSKSRHPAGVIIADRDVSEITALELDTNDQDQAVTQYDMKPVEKAGLVKFDFLGLQALTNIERCRQNLSKLGVEIDPWAISTEDKETYAELTKGYTVGVFQMESNGMTRAGRDIRLDNFEDIVALVALFRPGPMEFIPLYARRKKGLEPFGTPHPLLDGITKDTFGILIYQEQVMQAAQVLAGYTLGQADLLRRAMGKKIQAEMDAQRANFIKGCNEVNNIPEEQANALFDIIDKFAGYGFNRSHAAAYGLIAYVTAYLKTHYPAAFLAAALDGAVSDGKTEKIVALAQEAKRRGITLLPPKLQAECVRFTVPDDKTIRWSLAGISNVGQATLEAIAEESKKKPFASLEDFISRVGEHVNKKAAASLAAAGVFDGICESRQKAVLSMRESFEGMANEAKARRGGQQSLFGDDLVIETKTESIEEKEVLALEREALGLTLSAHPLDAYVNDLMAEGILTPGTAADIIDLTPVRVAGLVDEVRKGKNKGAWLTIRISDEKGHMIVGCPEDLQDAHLIQSGEVLILRVTSRVSNGERRLNIEEVCGVLETHNNKEGRVIDIHVSDNLDRNTLRRIIGTSDIGPDRFRIIHGENLEMTPSVASANLELIERIKTVDGVEWVEL